MKRQVIGVRSRGRLLLVAICVAVLLAAVAVQALGSFGKPRGFPVGSRPSSIRIGDFNGDGKRDMAVGNAGSRNVSILLGKGDGSFRKTRNYAAGSNPNALAIGRLNGDGKRDIALAVGSGVSVLLGRGDGSFGPPTIYPAGGAAWSIAIGDFDGNGTRDLAVVGNAGVSVLLGHGDGSFGPPASFPAGVNPESVVVGNFNADAKLDLAVANSGTVECGSRVAHAHASSCIGGFGTVSVLLGRGDGSFAGPTDFPVGDATQPIAMAVGNFNGDAKPDLALADFAQYADSVSVLLGKGDGSFGKTKFFPVDLNPNSIAVGDVNHDSRDDVVVAGREAVKSVSVLLGKGNGSFGAASAFSTGAGSFSTPTAVAIGNLNAGSNPDLAVVIAGNKNRVAVLLNARPSKR